MAHVGRNLDDRRPLHPARRRQPRIVGVDRADNAETLALLDDIGAERERHADPLKRRRDHRVQAASGNLLADDVDGDVGRRGVLIGAFGADRVEHIGDRADAGELMDRVGLAPGGIAAAVEALVVVAQRRQNEQGGVRGA